MIPSAPGSSVLSRLWFGCGERMREGRQANKGQERKSGKLGKKRGLKRRRAWQGAFSDHLELGSSTTDRHSGTPCPLLTINSNTKPGGTPTGWKVQTSLRDMLCELCAARWDKGMKRTVQSVSWLPGSPVGQPASPENMLGAQLVCKLWSQLGREGWEGEERGLVVPTGGQKIGFKPR